MMMMMRMMMMMMFAFFWVEITSGRGRWSHTRREGCYDDGEAKGRRRRERMRRTGRRRKKRRERRGEENTDIGGWKVLDTSMRRELPKGTIKYFVLKCSIYVYKR